MQKSEPKKKFEFDDFEKDHVVGQGTYGIVKKVKHKETGEIYAMKDLKMDNEKEGIPSTSLREITLLKNIDHPNVVKLHGILNKSYHKVSLLFEFMDDDLKEYNDRLDRGVFIPEEEVKPMVYQLLLG